MEDILVFVGTKRKDFSVKMRVIFFKKGNKILCQNWNYLTKSWADASAKFLLNRKKYAGIYDYLRSELTGFDWEEREISEVF